MSSPNPTPSSSTQTSINPLPTASTSLFRPPRYYMLTAFTNRLLPLALFTVLLITGTVILIYTVVDKKVLPPRYIVTSYITIAVIVGLWCALRMILFLRRKFGGLRTDDPERALRIGTGVQGGNRIDGINGLWGTKERRVKKCLKWLKETGMLLGKIGARNHRNRNRDGTRSSELESQPRQNENKIQIPNLSNTSQTTHPIQTPQQTHNPIPLQDLNLPPPTPPIPLLPIISPPQMINPAFSIPANTYVRSSRARSYPCDKGLDLNDLQQIRMEVRLHGSQRKRTRVTRSRDVLRVRHPEPGEFALGVVLCGDGEGEEE